MMTELLFLSSTEIDEQQQMKARINAFVKAFNQAQTPLYKYSLQYHIKLLRNDKEMLIELQTSLQTVYDAHSRLESQIKAFINTKPLNIKEIATPVYDVKKRHYKILGVLDTLHSRTSKEYELQVIQECITYCEEALEVKTQALSNLRKSASNQFVAMFDVFLLFRGTILGHIPSVFRHIMTNYYMRLIFNGVVLIVPIIIETAFDTLKKRTNLRSMGFFFTQDQYAVK